MDPDAESKLNLSSKPTSPGPDIQDASATSEINASDRPQALPRNFSLLSLAGIGLLVGNIWPATGGSILTAIFNGGPPGVLYEFIAVSVLYWTVAASIAELSSAMPSSAGVYLWASVTGGRAVGFFAGWWNYLAWVLGCASMASILGNTLVQMYALNHGGFEARAWHVFVAYEIVTMLACAVVCLFNAAMPKLNNVGLVAILAGFVITVVVLSFMPGDHHASSAFVWTQWTADIGYPDGFVFVAGMLNGAYSVGAVDAVTHLAEEIPRPQRNVPIALGLQMAIGFVTGLGYLITLMYAIGDYHALFESAYPVAEIYRQATGSAAGATGLLALLMICIGLTVVVLPITAGRTLWALARDGAAPFRGKLGAMHPRLGVPVWSTVATACVVAVLGCVYVGSTTAFNAFVGSFVLLSSSSYLAAIVPNLLARRANVPKYGPFCMRGWVGFVVNGVACAYMAVWFVIYCFPYSLPTSAQTMNYSCLIWGGLTVLVGIWWAAVARKGYEGPLAVLDVP